MSYIINDKGEQRDKHVRKEALKIFIVGPLNLIFILFLFYLGTSDNIALFYAGLPVILILHAIFGIYAPINMLLIHNKTVNHLSISKQREVSMQTFAPFWLTKKILNRPLNKLNIYETKFNSYGKDQKDGLVIMDDKKRYYLVKDFFDDYEEIKRQLIGEAT